MAVTIIQNLDNCTSNAPDTVDFETQLITTVTAKSGYVFDEPPYYGYVSSGEYQQAVFTLNTAKTVGTLTMDIPTNNKISGNQITLYGEAMQAETGVPVRKQLTNCTTDDPDSLEYETQITTTVTSYSGYVFDEPPYYGYLSHGEWVQNDFSLNTAKTVATITFDVPAKIHIGGGKIDLWGTGVKVQAIDIQKNLVNCTTDAPDTITGDTPFTTTVTANAGYEFEEQPKYQWENEYGETEIVRLTINDTKTKATVTFNSPSVSSVSKMTLYGDAVKVSAGLPIKQTLLNCNSNIGATIQWNTEFETIVTANAGFKFTKAPLYTWVDNLGETHNVTLTLSENDTVAKVTFISPKEDEYSDGFTLIATATQDIPYLDKYGSINVYNVTTYELESFSKQRYILDSNSETPKYEDLGEFIIKLHRVYCNIGDTIPALIQAAFHDTSVQARTPLNDLFTIDFGSIQVPEPNNDIVDYECEISLFLPFKGFVTLNTREVLGKEMRLLYNVNIVSGDCIANIEVDNIIVQSETLKLITEVFFRTYDTPSYFSVDYNVNALSGFIPYLVIKHYSSKMAQLYNNNERGVIGEFTGYHEFTNIVDIDALNATNDEIELIINNLQKGIIL